MLKRGFIFVLAAIAMVVVATLAPTSASAMRGGSWRAGYGPGPSPSPHPSAFRTSPGHVRGRVGGCPGRRREHVCVRWYAPHGGGPNRPAPVCIRYVWVNKCTG